MRYHVFADTAVRTRKCQCCHRTIEPKEKVVYIEAKIPRSSGGSICKTCIRLFYIGMFGLHK